MSGVTYTNPYDYPITLNIEGESLVIPPWGSVSYPASATAFDRPGNDGPVLSAGISLTTKNPPDGNRVGDRGFRRTSDNRLQGLEWNGMRWEVLGDPFGGQGGVTSASLPPAGMLDATVYHRLVLSLVSSDNTVNISVNPFVGLPSTDPILLAQIDVELLSIFFSSNASVSVQTAAPPFLPLASTELRLAIRASVGRVVGSSDNSIEVGLVGVGV